ncbi:hypothetical protein HY491_01930 [Candidatus Woesearchaeota archaeon]|nr:hypothetical protein [Candidatus Woesearchaeota archaeon]
MSTTFNRRELLSALAGPFFASLACSRTPLLAQEHTLVSSPVSGYSTERRYQISGPLHARGEAVYAASADGSDLSFILNMRSPVPYHATVRSRELPHDTTEFAIGDDACVHRGLNALSYYGDLSGSYAANGTIDTSIAEVLVAPGQRQCFQASFLQQQDGGLAGILVQPVTAEGARDPLAFSKLFAFAGVELYLDCEGACHRARALFTNGKNDFAYDAVLQT